MSAVWAHERQPKGGRMYDIGGIRNSETNVRRITMNSAAVRQPASKQSYPEPDRALLFVKTESATVLFRCINTCFGDPLS
jgi:hypothetical protein